MYTSNKINLVKGTHESKKVFVPKIELETARYCQNSKHDLETKSIFLFLYCSFVKTMNHSEKKNDCSVLIRRTKWV